MNKKVYVFISHNGQKGVKKVSLTNLIKSVNLELYTKKLFIDKKEAIKYNEQSE